MPECYLVSTDHGDVVVQVNDVTSGLDPDLFTLLPATAQNRAGLDRVVPLRAFAAKVLDIVELKGTGGLPGGERLLRMMVQEKATEELRRIERWARSRHGGSA